MQNQFSVKTVGILVVLVFTFGISFIDFTFALICFDCESVACDVGPIYLKKCQSETSICVLFKDVTGRALKKGPGHVYKRSCGVGTYPNNMSELKCMQYTANFDKCICRDDLCNGDDSLLELTTTTRVYPPSTTESGEEGGGGGSGEDSSTPNPGGNNSTTPNPGGNNGTTPNPGGNNGTTPNPGGNNSTTPNPGVNNGTTPNPGVNNGTTPRPGPGGNVTTPRPGPGGNGTTPRTKPPGPGGGGGNGGIGKPPGPGGGGGNNGTGSGKPVPGGGTSGGNGPSESKQKGRSMIDIQGRSMGGQPEERRTKCKKSKSKNNQAVLAQEDIPGSGE